MFIDVICFLLLLMAAYKGWSQGLIVALFSSAAFMIGLAAATKLSVVVAKYFTRHMQLEGRWLSVLSFVIVFVGVVILVRWTAAIIKKGVRVVLLGWLDIAGGILLYAILYMMIYSVILFFAVHIYLITPETIEGSKTYAYIKPFGPKVINGLGKIIPWFRGMFATLSNFFEGVSQHGR